MLVSTLVSALEGSEEAGSDELAGARLDLGQLVETFLDVDIAETTAALHVIAALTTDEMLRARALRGVGQRRQPMPELARTLGDVVVTHAVAVTDTFGDGENLVLGLAWPGGQHVSVIVYVDHNLGTVVKDAFFVAETPEAIVGTLRTIAEAEGQERHLVVLPLSPSDARERVRAALDEAGDFPGLEPTETWPGCRPLLELALRRIPGAGHGYDLDRLDDAATEELARAFLASPEARALEDSRGDLAAAGEEYADAETVDEEIAEYLATFVQVALRGVMRMSPAAVEILLVRWFGTTVPEGRDLLLRVPTVARAFVRYVHRVTGLDPADTTETLAAIDQWTPAYHELVDDPEAVTARLALGQEMWAAALGSVDWLRLFLADEVGGESNLAALDERPLPDEPLALTTVAPDVHAPLAEVAAVVDRFADEHFGLEFRTACRRLLTDIATSDPAIFRRGRVDTAAATIAWAVARANMLVGYPPAPMRAKDLQEWFGTATHPSQRARVMLEAIGAPTGSYAGHVALGSPRYLVSGYRQRLVARRDAG